jgi:hypothetical protein
MLWFVMATIYIRSVLFMSKESKNGYEHFDMKEYCKFHRDSKKEYEDWLEKKAKKAKLKVEHIAEF